MNSAVDENNNAKVFHEMPYALSDPSVAWKVTAENILGSASASCTVAKE